MPNKKTAELTIDISVGKYRYDKAWKNTEITWVDLLQKLSKTHFTAETHSQYIAAKKDRQDEIKDVGGFVGGIVTGGRRKSGNILNRQLITLDIDYGKPDFWVDFEIAYGCAACMYSTHKHDPEKPRLRLIIPLDRPVMVDEYQAIARKVAGTLNIEIFDPTTFQPERLMYWPSTSKDGVFVFEQQEGPLLSADRVLKTYTDWKDSSQWPVSERIGKVILKGMAKQGDPTEKPGVIGAFCRTYPIPAAIEAFLSETYLPCESSDDRYTYSQGSTAAGLVVYDDKFAFSHHGTDPISGKLCNAFDLVRIHKFGLKDEDAREGSPHNKLPSYTAMVEYAAKDKQVRAAIVSDRLAEVHADFPDEEILEAEVLEAVDDAWKEKLDIDRKGNIYSTIDNILLIFENDPYLKGRIAFDDFEKCEVALKNLAWRKITHATRRLVDVDDACIRHYLEKAYGISHATKTKDAMQVLSNKTSFHPVKDYLNSCTWDGVRRLDTLIVDYLGAEDNEFVRTVTRKTFTAAVARVFQPGCKFDYMLTLVGAQGVKKSTLFNKLGRQWFSDSFSTIEGTRAFEQLQGAWLVEVPELSALERTSTEAIKAFIVKREDRYRVAFGRRVEIFPRQCIFLGTTNKTAPLKDHTGGRRFWPVRVHINTPAKSVAEDLNEDEIQQLWAEAVVRYKKGEKLYLSDKMEAEAKIIQKDHTDEHPWTGIIQQYIDIKLPGEWGQMLKYDRLAFLQDELSAGTVERDRVCVHEIWIEALNRRDTIGERDANIIREIMYSLPGWKEVLKQRRFGIYGLHRKGFFKASVLENASAD